MNKRSISMLVVTGVACCGVATTLVVHASTGSASASARTGAASAAPSGSARPAGQARAAGRASTASKAAAANRAARAALTASRSHQRRLPAGVSTATSFWDGETASGKPMSYETIASPYWPLGTQVRITYKARSTVGVVEDFGPAEWAVAQHNPPAIVDLSEKMMARLTGVRSNSVTVKFQVLRLGSGRVYRHSGTGYDRAMSR